MSHSQVARVLKAFDGRLTEAQIERDWYAIASIALDLRSLLRAAEAEAAELQRFERAIQALESGAPKGRRRDV
jgi:hypothetical protein